MGPERIPNNSPHNPFPPFPTKNQTEERRGFQKPLTPSGRRRRFKMLATLSWLISMLVHALSFRKFKKPHDMAWNPILPTLCTTARYGALIRAATDPQQQPFSNNALQRLCLPKQRGQERDMDEACTCRDARSHSAFEGKWTRHCGESRLGRG